MEIISSVVDTLRAIDDRSALNGDPSRIAENTGIGPYRFGSHIKIDRNFATVVLDDRVTVFDSISLVELEALAPRGNTYGNFFGSVGGDLYGSVSRIIGLNLAFYVFVRKLRGYELIYVNGISVKSVNIITESCEESVLFSSQTLCLRLKMTPSTQI